MGRLLIVMTCLALHTNAYAIKFIASENPPFSYLTSITPAKPADTPTPKGLAIDIALAMAKKANIPVDNLSLFPLIRAIKQTQIDNDTCVFPLVRNQEREALYQWVGPFAKNYWAFYARNDFKARLNTVEDAKKFLIGSGEKSARAIYLEEQGFQRTDLAADEAVNPKKLQMGRFDLWLIGLYEGKIFADTAGVHNIKPVFVVKKVDFYIACNLNMQKETINKLQAAYEALQREGVVERLTTPYEKKFGFPGFLTK